MTKFEDHLWREVARQHGPEVELAGRPRARHSRLQPRILAGSTLGLAGLGATLALVLGAASTPPAFAVTRNHDGTVTVWVKRSSGIAGANARLHKLGIRAMVLPQAPARCTDLPITQQGAPAPSINAHWTIDRKVPAGQILALAPAQGRPGNSGNSGNSGTAGNSGNSGAGGNSGNSGDSGNSGTAGNSGNSGTAGNSGNSGTAGNSGNSGTGGNSGTATTGGSQVPAPTDHSAAGQVWTCNVRLQPTPGPGAGNSGNSGNSGNTGNS